MRRTLFVILFFLLLIVIFLLVRKCSGKKQVYVPIRADSIASDSLARPLYREDQILVFYKDTPTPADVSAIKDALIAMGVTDSVNIRRCNTCSSYVELWSADGIHTVINTEGVVGGSGRGGSKGVGEDSVASYSLNFLVRPPLEQKDMHSSKDILNQSRGDNQPRDGSASDTVLVAVLDTGIDTTFIQPRYLWTNPDETSGSNDPDGNCFVGDRRGWNFVSNNPNVAEDHPNLHGTLVTKYIIDAFEENSRNFVQILPLKTHDQTGYGDLFNTICAIHYAIDKGANMINASWGFYYYEEDPHPYLSKLITKELTDKGILFMAAAGNKMDDADVYAKDLYQRTNGIAFPDSLLRNLFFHNFYPACLSDSGQNVLSITTSDSTNVSPTQNFYADFVDSGVLADTVMPGFMKFKLPFTNATAYVSGSSFAVAIFTGAVAANLPKAMFQPGIKKSTVLEWLETNSSSHVIPLIFKRAHILEDKNRIDRGRYLE